MTKRLALIGAPTSAGAYAPGQEKAPAALRAHGIAGALRDAGWEVRDAGDVEGFRWRPDLTRPKAMHLDAVARIATAVSAHVTEALRAQEIALVLGGDCTIELGTVAGALCDGKSVGLLYIDLDTDLNTPQSSDGALDWTGVAHLLDLDGAARELSSIGPRRPMLSARDILYFGASLATQTKAERIAMETLRPSLISLDEVHRDPIAAARRAVEWSASFDRLAVHLDVDVLSFIDFPIADNVRRDDGLSLAELTTILRHVAGGANFATLTIAELNPDHAPVLADAMSQFIAMLATALGDRR